MKYGKVIFIFISLLSITSTAYSQEVDKAFKDWTVYTTTLQGKKTCYIGSFPKIKKGNFSKRDNPYFLVTKVPTTDGKTSYEVSASSGYKYKDNGEITADIGGKNYKMFTKDDVAWAYDSNQDQEMIDLMRKKSSLIVRGISAKGTYSVDNYSLLGFSAAFDHIGGLCN